MVVLSRVACAVTLFGWGSGARFSRGGSGEPRMKTLANIPILNYDKAYGGLGMKSVEQEEDWLVMTKRTTSDEEIDNLCHNCLRGHPSEGGVGFFKFRGTEAELEGVLEQGNDLISFVEPNQDFELPDEPKTTKPIAPMWGLERVGAKFRPASGGQGVTVHVLDTGVRWTHQDFGGRASAAVDYTGLSPVECVKGDLECAKDVQGHGTHCAGSAAGATFGVAPKARVKGLKLLGDNGMGNMFAIIGSMDWTAKNGDKPGVASMSLGGPGVNPALGLAVDAMVRAGITVVVAAGNSNVDACLFSPAFAPSSITIGSTTSADVRSSFSNFGMCVNLWAPGSLITSATNKADVGGVTYSGTSMACPHVAGGAALVLSQNPTFKSAQVLKQLQDNASKNYLQDLKSTDKNLLLYVGAGGAPPPAETDPTTCPAWCVACIVDRCKNNCVFCKK